MMDEDIVSLNDSIVKFRPIDEAKRSSLAEELEYLSGQLTESRLFLNSSFINL